MARFRFQLEGVLRHRLHLEREKQRILAEKQRVVTTLTDELRDMTAAMTAAVADVRDNRLRGSVDLSFLALHLRYQTLMKRRAVEQAQRIALAQRVVDLARSELAEAAKQRKIIEKLREKRFEAWRADQELRERVAMDEIGTQLAVADLPKMD